MNSLTTIIAGACIIACVIVIIFAIRVLIDTRKMKPPKDDESFQ